MNATQLLNTVPAIILNKLQEGFMSLERPDYHPERYLFLHIMEVVERGCQTGDPCLMAAALLHDICKHQKPFEGVRGGTRQIEVDGVVVEYHSNPSHPIQAYNFIVCNEEVEQWIESIGANVLTVCHLVRYHMDVKNVLRGEQGIKGGMKAVKRERFWNRFTSQEQHLMRVFARMDDMTQDFVN